MQTADVPQVASTRKLLPEMPYVTAARPAPFAGPKASTAALAASVTPGDYMYLKGAGRVQSGWLTLADKSARGYGTMGQSEAPVSYINPVQEAAELKCVGIYLGIIAYPLVDQVKGYLSLSVNPVEWSPYPLIANERKTAPVGPFAREAAAFFAAGAASIALVGMSLF
jgi:hypothetical protein